MSTLRKLPTEQERHLRAFEQYYARGGERSHEKLASELGVSTAAVKSWSRAFNWAKRVAERDATAARQIADQSLQSTVDELGRNKKIVQLALVKLAKAIANGQIKMQLGDLDRLIRLQAHLDGYVESQTWSDLSMEQLAARFYWVMWNTSEEESDRFMTEYKRLDEARSLIGSEPPP